MEPLLKKLLLLYQHEGTNLRWLDTLSGEATLSFSFLPSFSVGANFSFNPIALRKAKTPYSSVRAFLSAIDLRQYQISEGLHRFIFQGIQSVTKVLPSPNPTSFIKMTGKMEVNPYTLTGCTCTKFRGPYKNGF